MQPFIYQDTPLGEREQLLKNQAAKSETRNYSHSLQQTEISYEESKYVKDAIDVAMLEEQLKNHIALETERIKAIKKRMAETMLIVRTGQITVNGVLYGLIDHQQGKMFFYDKFGEMIESRGLLPDELQMKLFIKGGGKQTEANYSDAVVVVDPATATGVEKDEIQEVQEVVGDVGVQLSSEAKEEELPGASWAEQQAAMDKELPIMSEKTQEQLQAENAEKNRKKRRTNKG